MIMSSGSSESPLAESHHRPHRLRVIIFRVVAVLAGLFFVVAVVLMASAPWVLLQPDQVTRTELNRWFLTVAGSVDAIAAGVLLALALRPHQTLLIVEHTGAALVAGAIILPFQPSFAAILAGVVPLIGLWSSAARRVPMGQRVRRAGVTPARAESTEGSRLD